MFFTTLQYSYLFGFLPALMIGAIDDILSHVRRIAPVVRMLLVGVIAFVAAELLYGWRGPDSGAFQFVMYGLVGFIPGAVSSWLVHKFVGELPGAGAAAGREGRGCVRPGAHAEVRERHSRRRSANFGKWAMSGVGATQLAPLSRVPI